jgi:nicotinamidase-related amidase
MRKLVLLICLLGIIALSNGQTPGKRLLIVIDVQENLLNPNSKIHIEKNSIDLFINNVNKAIFSFINTNDQIVYIVNENTNPIINWMMGNVCKKGEPGVGLDKRLLVINDRIYKKSKPNALTNKELLKYLQENNFSEIFVAGLLAEGCVKATVKGLKSEKMNVMLVDDALGSKSQKNKQKVIHYFNKKAIKMVSAKDL